MVIRATQASNLNCGRRATSRDDEWGAGARYYLAAKSPAI